MSYLKFVFLLLPALAAVSGSAQNGFTRLPGGMYYKIVPEGKGNPVPANGVIRFHLDQRINDSVIFSSFGKGLSAVALAKADRKDETSELFRQLRAGDSLVTLNLADDMLKNKDLVLPDFIHAGDSLFQCFRVADVFATEAEYEKYRAADKKRRQMADEKAIVQYLTTNKIKAARTPLGCYVETLKKGTGVRAVKASGVGVRYTGKLLDGTFFDGNENPAESKPLLEFTTGAGAMIPGFDEAVSLLQKGGRCRVFIPSPQGFDENGAGDLIPPNAILMFDIELVNLKPPKISKKPTAKRG